MKEAKVKNKYGSIRVEPGVAQEAKELCKKTGMLLTYFCNEAIKEKINKTKIELKSKNSNHEKKD